ncbi:MAG: hypothetical protein K0U47_00205 [Epsilonproteobacteria bacterium]|nr:hypothetical protein [Campylobacterota bacterium]
MNLFNKNRVVVLLGSVIFLVSSLSAQRLKESNATFIHLPKIPQVNYTPVVPVTPVKQSVDLPQVPKTSKAQKVLPLITVTPEQNSVKTKQVSEKEYLEYQKLKSLENKVPQK